MALKLKSSSTNSVTPSGLVFEYNITKGEIPHLPAGIPNGLPIYSYVFYKPIRLPEAPALEMPESNLPRAVQYFADLGGCSAWRMIWPEYLLNLSQKAVVHGNTCMVLDPRWYQGIKAIRMQRQATPVQLQFIKELKKLSTQFGFRLIYEVDDITYREDIPDYNRCKDAFIDDSIVKSIGEIMGLCDEISVTCNYMKQYYQEKTGNKKITVIPNYPPKFWLGRYYDREKVQRMYEKNKKRPRVLYSGSGTHVDVMNRTGLKDDFGHVVDDIIKARKKFKFVWKGCYPLAVKPFIDSGEMEFLDWSHLPDYPQGIYDAKCNVSFASLVDNNFNKSKSNIKMVEAGAFGMPGAYQDMCTYEDAQFKFKTGAELIDQLTYITSDVNRYMKASDNAYAFTDKLWLEDHISEYEALLFTPWGSKERKQKCPRLIELNPDQDIA
jgi:hypothetical protein